MIEWKKKEEEKLFLTQWWEAWKLRNNHLEMALVGLTLALGVVDVRQGFFASSEIERPIGISIASSCSLNFSSPSKLARQLDVCCKEALLISSKCLELFSSFSSTILPNNFGLFIIRTLRWHRPCTTKSRTTDFFFTTITTMFSFQDTNRKTNTHELHMLVLIWIAC